MEFVVGTYEELLLGYKLVDNEDSKQFEASFTDHSHIGCVKAVSVSPRGILASGSSDETIRLLNLRSRVELGSLMHHEGSITGLVFFGKTHMFSTSEDGTIGVWRVGKWECLRTLRGHKGPVHSVCIHPSGKLALSVSGDKTLRTWNLITGKCAYVTNIKQVADLVQWSPDGSMYVIVINNKMDFYKVETAAVCHTIQCDSRIYAVLFLQDNVVAIAGEGGQVQFYDITSQKRMFEFSTETNRVRGMVQCRCGMKDSFRLATASSDGHLKLWVVKHKKGSWSSHLEAAIDTKFRITCLAVTSEDFQSSLGDPGPTQLEKQPIQEENGGDTSEDSEPGLESNRQEILKKSAKDKNQSKQKGKKKRKSSPGSDGTPKKKKKSKKID